MEKRYPLTMMCCACVPWTKDLDLDEAAFRKEVKGFIDGGAKSIYIFGTAGEGYAVDMAMFKKVVTVFVDECGKAPDVMPMTGIISTSMMEIMDRVKAARDIGCKDFQVALPCWGALSDDEVMVFFRTLCGSFPDCRFIHYNNGARTKRLCKIDMYVRLAKEVPNLVAVKYSTANIYEIYEIVTTECPITFFFVDSGYTFGSVYGACGLLNSFASIDIDLSWKYFYAGQQKDYKTLNGIGAYFIELANSFNFLEHEFIDSAYDKSIERSAEPGFCNSLYPPYIGLSEEEFAIADKNMKAALKKYKGKF